MAQKMIELKLNELRLHKQKRKLEKLNKFIESQEKSCNEKINRESTPTVPENFFIQLSKTKHATLKYSKSYRDTVLAMNINSTKSFIITREMWKIFFKNINFINKEFCKPPKNGSRKISDGKK
jgi:hypothetical protein